MPNLDTVIHSDYDAMSMSSDNLKQIIDEAVDRVLSGSADPIAFCISRATNDDHLFKFSYSDNGWSFDEVDIYTY